MTHNADGFGPIAMVGGIPAHYMRRLHIELERRFGSRLHFYYVHDRGISAQRHYEVGAFPKNSTFLNGWRGLRTLSAVLSRSKLIVFHGHYPPALAILLLMAALSRRRFAYWSDTSVVDILRLSALRRTFLRMVGRPLLQRAFALLYVGTCNLMFYEWLLAGGATVRYHCVPYPHSPHEFDVTHLPLQTRRPKRILFVGRLAPEKNVDGLLAALSLLPADVLKSWECRIVGDGPERGRLEEMAGAMGLSSLVVFAGAVTSQDVSREFANADLFVLPSRKEPWGLVINEALSARLPVAASRLAGATVDLVHEGVTGLRIDPNVPLDIARKLEILMRDEKLRAKLGDDGHRHVQMSNWSLHGAVAGFEELFLESDAIPP